MASSSALVIPLSIFLIGTRVWALGKKYGFMTPVQMFRDRWECSHIGTVIFAVQAVLLLPYVIIGIMGGGTTLATISGGVVPFWFGGAIVAMVVMSYVFFGGMRGTAWVNTFQTILFLCFGAIAIVVIGYGMGGFRSAVEATASLARDRSAPDARAHLAALLFQLYLHPAFSHRFPAHPHLLPDSAQDGAVQKDCHLLPALHHGDLAAVRLSRRDGKPRRGRAADSCQAGSAPCAGDAGQDDDAGRSATNCAKRRREMT